MVRVSLDKSKRLVASARIDEFLQDEASGLEPGQEVQLLIADSTELGFKAIVDNSHWGVLYSNELFQPISRGQRLTGYIKKIRPDGKIDLSLSLPSHEQVDQVSESIINTLKQHDGFIAITDKTPPETIYSTFKVSKKVYKKAVGALYKQRRIEIETAGNSLTGFQIEEGRLDSIAPSSRSLPTRRRRWASRACVAVSCCNPGTVITEITLPLDHSNSAGERVILRVDLLSEVGLHEQADPEITHWLFRVRNIVPYRSGHVFHGV